MALFTDNALSLAIPGVLAVAGQVPCLTPFAISNQGKYCSVIQSF